MSRLVVGVVTCALLIACGSGSDSAESGSAATSTESQVTDTTAASSGSAAGTSAGGTSASDATSMTGEQLLTAALEGEMSTVRDAVESGVDVNDLHINPRSSPGFKLV